MIELKFLCCKRPPDGWWCSRPEGHDGPCAARPDVAPHAADSMTSEGRANAEDASCRAEYQRLADEMLHAAQTIRVNQVQGSDPEWPQANRDRCDEAWQRLNLAHEAMTKALGNE